MKRQLKPLLQKIFGFKNYLLAFSLYSIRKSLRGNYEEDFAYFIKMIPATGIILDIGANIGITTVALSKFRREAEVHAFEPILENFKTLQRVSSIYQTGNVKLYNLALGNSEGTLKMILPVKDHAKQQGLSKVYKEGDEAEGIIYTVPVKKLDEIFPGDMHIKAIKIDVENYEYEVLKGAENILKMSHPVIYCELWKNEKRQTVFNYMMRLSYEIYVYIGSGKGLKRIDTDYSGQICNFFFVPENTSCH